MTCPRRSNEATTSVPVDEEPKPFSSGTPQRYLLSIATPIQTPYVYRKCNVHSDTSDTADHPIREAYVAHPAIGAKLRGTRRGSNHCAAHNS
eukprot:8118855-Pyramimonas_sp.AAC.1